MTAAVLGATWVAVLVLLAVAVAVAVVCARSAMQARDEAAGAVAAARRVASWCGVPEWWVPHDQWPTERPPRDVATREAQWNAAHGVTPPRGDSTWQTLQQTVRDAADAPTTETAGMAPSLADVILDGGHRPAPRYRRLGHRGAAEIEERTDTVEMPEAGEWR